jgi:UDP-N-acetylmuramoylalanine--D-glutamate ligase
MIGDRRVLELAGRKVAIIGAAATGRAAGPVLARRGASVVVYDAKPVDELREAAAELQAQGVEVRLGDDRYSGIDEADLIVPSPGVPAEAAVLRDADERGVPIMAEIELAGAIASAPIIAVTGTNGKTTTVMMPAAALGAAGRDVIVGGNTLAGGYQVPLIAAADRAPASACIVAEVSSFQLERTAQFRPRVAVITNISADHLNRHGTMDAYVAAKARLLGAQTEEDWTILNADNPPSAGLAPRARGKVLFFSRDPDFGEMGRLGGWVRSADDRWLVVNVRGGTEAVCRASDLRVPGEHTIENALAAALAAVAMGALATQAGQGLAEFRGVPDRLEYVATIGGVDYINNTMCTNVDAAIRSLEAYCRPVVLIAGGRDKGSNFAPLGEAIARRARRLITIGEHGDRIAESARSAGFHEIESASSMREAVQRAAARAVVGDVALLSPACASFDWFNSFEERGAAFKEAVAELEEQA